MARAVASRARPSALLFLLCLAVGAAVYRELDTDYWSRLPSIASPPPPPEMSLPEPLPEFRLAPLSDFSASLDRPLFLPDRRPPEPEETVQEEAPVAPTPLKVTVSGVIIVDERTFALVQRDGQAEILRLAVRDTVDGWSVQEILADRVVFRRDAESQTVELKDKTQQRQPTQERPDRRRQPAVKAPANQPPPHESRPTENPPPSRTPLRNREN